MIFLVILLFKMILCSIPTDNAQVEKKIPTVSQLKDDLHKATSDYRNDIYKFVDSIKKNTPFESNDSKLAIKSFLEQYNKIYYTKEFSLLSSDKKDIYGTIFESSIDDLTKLNNLIHKRIKKTKNENFKAKFELVRNDISGVISLMKHPKIPEPEPPIIPKPKETVEEFLLKYWGRISLAIFALVLVLSSVFIYQSRK